MRIEPSVAVVKYSFWKRIPRFIRILYTSNLTIKQAWIASRADRLFAWELKIDKDL